MFPSSQGVFERLFEKTTTYDASPLESFVSSLGSNSSKKNQSFFSMNQLTPQALLQDVDAALARCEEMQHCPDEASRLQRMDEELAVASGPGNASTMAFQLAQKVAPALVQDESFRTMFLRADPTFDPKKAAQRMIKFFQHKLQLFGIEKLGKTITMNDLSDEDRNILYRGRTQILKEKDQSGKTVICTIVQNGETIANQSRPSILRVLYYLTMSALKDEAVQKQGFVSLTYAMDQKQQQPSSADSSIFSFDTNAVLACSSLRNALPARYVSLHYCFGSDSFQSYINCDRIGFDESTQPCIFMHQVSSAEFKYELQRHGLPVASVPVSFLENKIKRNNHEEWLDAQKFCELLENGDSTLDEDLFSNGTNVVVQDLEPKPIREGTGKGPTPLLGTSFLPPWGLGQQQRGCGKGDFAQSPAFVNAAGSSPAYTSISNISSMMPSAAANSMDAVFTNVYNQFTSTAMNFPLVSFARQQQLKHQQTPSPAVVQSISHTDMNQASSMLSCQPRKFDVLFGRGKVKDHYGNVYLHQLIAMKSDRYEAAERWEKTIIAEEIVAIIRENGGRFLKPTKDTSNPWMEVNHEVAREKVAHTFRSRRSKLEQQSKLPGSSALNGTS